LKTEGIECDVIGSLAESENSGRYDVAIVDINLPDGSGLDLFVDLQNAGRVERGIFFSATTQPEEILRARNLGRFVPKSDGAQAVVRLALALRRTTTAPRSGTRPSSPDLFEEITGTDGCGSEST